MALTAFVGSDSYLLGRIRIVYGNCLDFMHSHTVKVRKNQTATL